MAWLRKGAHHGPSSVILGVLSKVADAIERGDHLSKPEHEREVYRDSDGPLRPPPNSLD